MSQQLPGYLRPGDVIEDSDGQQVTVTAVRGPSYPHWDRNHPDGPLWSIDWEAGRLPNGLWKTAGVMVRRAMVPVTRIEAAR
jgi:hypothetical protein